MPDHPVPHHDVAGYVLGVLEPEESRDFAAHLRTCLHCQQEVADLASLRTLLDHGLSSPALPEGLAERTFAAVARQAGAGPATPADPPLPVGRTRRARRGRPMAALGLAAAVVAGLLLATRSTDLGREVTLVATDGGTAQASARLRRGEPGITVELVVKGLAAPPGGSFYECWYVAEDDSRARPARLSAGTFIVSPDGRTMVRMTTAADPERYSRIEVTLEPDDGDPRRTGPVVLRSRPRPSRAGTD